MGNAQSTEAPRRSSQRLSKPKTGNHATASLLGPGPFSNGGRRLSNAQLPNPPAPSSTAASTPTTASAAETSGGLDRRIDSITSLQSAPVSRRESRRRSLFRSRSTRGADPASQSHSGGPGSRMRDKMTRASSMTYESAVAYYSQADPESQRVRSESCASWNYNPTSYEAKRLLNLTEEPGLEQAAAMSENRMTVVTESTWKSSNPAHSPSAPISRANSDLSLYMPVRRRSIIQTPGVATRSTMPQPNYRHSHPPTPSLSRQQSIDSHRGGIVSMPPWIDDPDSVPRVSTPCEDKYLSIGAFKLGSLRITNGSPAPLTPDVDRAHAGETSRISRTEIRDGYFAQVQAPGAGAAEGGQGRVQSPKYLPELNRGASGPTAQPSPTNPALQTTSKLTALEDHLFDEDAQPEYSSVEVLDVRLDPSAKPPHAEVARNSGVSVTRTDSGFVSATSPASEAPAKPLAKADSGYSSNVSLRSFQAKAQVRENQTEVSHSTTPEREPSPPPVPPKDPARGPWAAQARSGSITRKSLPQDFKEAHTMSPRSTARQPLSPMASPSRRRGPASPQDEIRSPRSVESSSSGQSSSTPSAGGSQKAGRLQRFLSGSRRPATHRAHTPDEARLPPAPRDMEHKMREHSSRFPTAAKKLALKSRSSMDTLKTIFSVGSLETSLDPANAVQTARAVPDPDTGEGVWKQTLTSAPVSIANVAAHVVPRKSVSRKPVPTRQDPTKRYRGNDEHDSGAVGDAFPVEPNTSLRSPRSGARGRSVTVPSERGVPGRLMSDLDLARSIADLPSPALPSPVAKALAAEKCGAAQPVQTRARPLSLRVPPPLRSQSSTASLSRRTSRESIRSYPALHTRTSTDSIRSYASNQPGTAGGVVYSQPTSEVTMDPRRLQAFRGYQSNPSSSYDPQSGDMRTDHSVARRSSQTFTASNSRRNSISSVQSEGAYYAGRATPGYHSGTTHPPLRHRASYDGYHLQSQSWLPRNGHPPSMSNGYTAPPIKPVAYARHSRATPGQVDVAAAAGQWYMYQGAQQQQQQQQAPPHVPRGHYRNRSGHAANLPYRVLHSYNSPAYRHAPIWG